MVEEQSAISEHDTIDLSLFRDLGQNALVEALNSVRALFSWFVHPLTHTASQVNGSKTLVLDPSLAGPLGLLTEISLLKVGLGRESCGPFQKNSRSFAFAATWRRQNVLA